MLAEAWTDGGDLSEVRYFDLSEPIRKEELDRPVTAGPFDRNGNVMQKYRVEVDPGYADSLEATFAGRWPPGSPFVRRFWLFQSVPRCWTFVEHLEAAHQRRERWRHTTDGLHTQAAQAAAELAATADARAGAPYADLDHPALQTELARSEELIWAATHVAERHETLATTCHNQAADLATRIAQLTATRLHLSVAEATIAAERATAARLDQLHATLDGGRFIRRVRGAARQQLTDEMHQLVNTNPGLVVAARREQRWATIAQRAEHADQRQLDQLQNELDHATTQAHHHTAAAIPAGVEVAKQTQRAATLRAELARRPQPPTPTQPPAPTIGAHPEERRAVSLALRHHQMQLPPLHPDPTIQPTLNT